MKISIQQGTFIASIHPPEKQTSGILVRVFVNWSVEVYTFAAYAEDMATNEAVKWAKDAVLKKEKEAENGV